MPRTDADLSGVLIFDNDSLGMIAEGSCSGTPPTTASKFSVGCQLQDTNSGKTYRNTGTVLVPVWSDTEANTNAELGTTAIQVVQVSLSSAQILALYTTSVEIIPAVSGKAIILDSLVFDLTGTATQYANGGVVNLQYKNTANGAGTTLHADIAATVVNGATARTVTYRIPLVQTSIATADIVGIGVFIGAKTANFATGTGTAVVTARYSLV